LIKSQKRICFKYGNEDYVTVRVPTKSDSGAYLPNKEWEEKVCDEDDLLGVLCDMEELSPEMPSFLILMNNFLPLEGDKYNMICPVGLISDEDSEVINLEGLCDAYKMAPFSPATLDGQPPVLLDIFQTIRAEKNKYEVVKMQNAREKKK